MSGRIATSAGDLARRGFAHAAQSARWAEALDERGDATFDWLGIVASAAADPDRALLGLLRLAETSPAQFAKLWADESWFTRVVRVIGASQAVQQHFILRPEDLDVLAKPAVAATPDELRARLLDAMGRSDLAPLSVGELAGEHIADAAAGDALRVANRREVIRIAGRDLDAADPSEVLPSVARELADLADAVLACVLLLARGEVAERDCVRLGVVALGKCGARELNYISDVDVLYVGEPVGDVPENTAMAVGGRIAGAVARICSARTPAGSIWQLDAALRPEGNAGPLVRTLAGMRAYYERWAHKWEFQAMLKARPMAGDVELAQQFCDLVGPLVWQVGSSENFVSDTQAMRRRVISLIPPKESEREIKLSAGGLRDVEFSVQLLQLVHGRADERIRSRGTLEGLGELVECGYIGRADGAELDRHYRFMRSLEHRVQLTKLRRTHLLPDDPEELRQLGRSLRLGADADVWTLWRRAAAEVQVLHQRVFYSPLLEAVSKLTSDELRLSPEAAQARLRALGFGDPAAALGHIAALTQGVTRSVEIQRQLMPAMLGWFAEGPNPDLGLLAFRQLSESLGRTPWYLRALRDEGNTAERLARLLSSSRYVVDLLRHDPGAVELLINPKQLVPRPRAELLASMKAVTERHDDAQNAINAVRALRRRELFRLAVGDLVGLIGLDELGRGLSDLAAATVNAAFNVAAEEFPSAPPIGVLALGRWGGREMSYGSDADAMFVIADDREADLDDAKRVVARARELLRKPGPVPPLELDADLRPEGRSGPMVRTLSSYLAYYSRWSVTWEAQALVRADFGTGDVEVLNSLLAKIDEVRWPVGGLTPEQTTDIRKLKLRMQRERIGRRVDPTRHLKLGPGGLSDIEWTVQLLQLRHAHEIVELRTPNTRQALLAARDHGLISNQQAKDLIDAWEFASRIRNATMLVRGRGQDTLPSDARDIAASAMLLGYGKAEASSLVDDWQRAARHASKVVDQVFWEVDRT